MTEKTTPELPFTLATDEDGKSLVLEKSNYPAKGSHFIRRDADDIGVFVDPAELMRNLSAFVPAVVPVKLLDADGDVWGQNEDGTWYCGVAEGPTTWDSWRAVLANHGGSPLYAHPPVTAEPATAPSVEQIAEVLIGYFMSDSIAADAAEKIRDLYGSSGSADEDLVRGLERDRDWYRNQRNALSNELSQARKFEALAKEAMTNRDQMEAALGRAETEVEEHREYALLVNREVGRGDTLKGIRDLRAEVERHKAALEAAEARFRATDTVIAREREMLAADRKSDEAAVRLEEARQWHIDARETYDAARAAVEAETSEEAGA